MQLISYALKTIGVGKSSVYIWVIKYVSETSNLHLVCMYVCSLNCNFYISVLVGFSDLLMHGKSLQIKIATKC